MKRRNAVFVGTLAALLLLGGILVLLPTNCDVSAERIKSAESLVLLSPLRAAITERAGQRQSLEGAGNGLDVEPFLKGNELIDYLHVTSDGVMIVRTAQGSMMTLIPALEQGKVVWRCVGGPRNEVPAVCRN